MPSGYHHWEDVQKPMDLHSKAKMLGELLACALDDCPLDDRGILREWMEECSRNTLKRFAANRVKNMRHGSGTSESDDAPAL